MISNYGYNWLQSTTQSEMSGPHNTQIIGNNNIIILANYDKSKK